MKGGRFVKKMSGSRSAGACPPRSSRRRDLPVSIPANVRWRAVGETHPCRSGSPDPDPFGIRRSRTTEVGPMRKHGEGQALALRKGAAFFHRSAGACPPRSLHGEGNPLGCACGIRGPKPYGERGPFFALREAWQFPNQPHRLLTDMHHLPHQPNDILRIRTIRIRYNPTPIRIGFHAIPVDEPF